MGSNGTAMNMSSWHACKYTMPNNCSPHSTMCKYIYIYIHVHIGKLQSRAIMLAWSCMLSIIWNQRLTWCWRPMLSNSDRSCICLPLASGRSSWMSWSSWQALLAQVVFSGHDSCLRCHSGSFWSFLLRCAEHGTNGCVAAVVGGDCACKTVWLQRASVQAVCWVLAVSGRLRSGSALFGRGCRGHWTWDCAIASCFPSWHHGRWWFGAGVFRWRAACWRNCSGVGRRHASCHGCHIGSAKPINSWPQAQCSDGSSNKMTEKVSVFVAASFIGWFKGTLLGSLIPKKKIKKKFQDCMFRERHFVWENTVFSCMDHDSRGWIAIARLLWLLCRTRYLWQLQVSRFKENLSTFWLF